MGKAYLVARREYVDNVRTKTFWIGVLTLPVIYVLAIALFTWFRASKDVRKYAVIDRSGWLFDAIRKESEGPDFVAVLRELRTVEDPPPGGFPEVLEAEPWSLVKTMTDGEFEVMAAAWSLVDRARRGPPATADLLASLGGLVERTKKLAQEGSSPAMEEWGRQVLARGSGAAAWVESTLAATADWWRKLSAADDGAARARAKRLAADPERGRYEYVDVPGDEAELRKRLDAGELFAFFVIDEDPVGSPEDGGQGSGGGWTAGKYVSNNWTDRDLYKWFVRRHATELVRHRRLEELELNPAQARWLSAPLAFEQKKLAAGGKEEKVEKKDVVDQAAPVVFVVVLWLSIMVIVQMLITNMIEEKSNRIIEVLLSSVSPLQLMSGKILGLAATGFSIVASWAIFLVLGIEVLPLFYPQIGTMIAEFGIQAILAKPIYLTSFLTYFILGYLLYAVVIAGIGSVFNSLKEAQNVISPIMIVMMIPYLASFAIVSDPNGTLARVMSYIPPFTPFIMMGRSAGPPPAIDYVLTTALLLASIAVGFYLAAKVFRIGILMTGKPPKLREILRWMRAPVGTVPQAAE